MTTVVFSHCGNEKYSYLTNTISKISYGSTEDTIEFQDAESKDYSIVVYKQNVYETPMCYAQIINPLLFALKFKVISNTTKDVDSVLNSYHITFSNIKDGARLLFVLSGDGETKDIKCVECRRVSNLNIQTEFAPAKIKKRFIITNIINTLLWMIVSIAILLLPSDEIGIAVSLVAIFITVIVSLYAIFNIVKQVVSKR